MDFVSRLPKTNKRYDFIWIIVDKLTKFAYFLPVRVNYSLDKLAKLYIDEIVKLHGIPVSIVLDRDSRFTSRFWKCLEEAMRTKLRFSMAFHHRLIDSQKEPFRFWRIYCGCVQL